MFATVLATLPDLGTTERISEKLISMRLAACANYFPTRSMYRWKGALERSEEYVLLLKIRAEDFEKVSEAIVSMHPYQVPCIVMYHIAAGFPPYLDWVRESTDRSRAD